MNNIDYNQSGGFPLSTQILDAAQNAYKNFNAFGNLAGALSIIDGCEPASGGTVTNGFVSIYGELLPFLGNTISDNVVIIEVPDARGFEDGSVKAVIYSRYATFGDGVVTYPWANFRRPMTLFQLEDRLTQLEKSVPIGLVAIWGKPANEIPEGWVEHTDLAGNVPAGHNPGDVNFGALNAVIGTAQVTLDINQIPAHTHDTRINASGDDVDSDGYGSALNASNREIVPDRLNVVRVQSKGGGQSHTNIQPSRIVKFIRFIGFS